MSHYSSTTTVFKNKACLIQALMEVKNAQGKLWTKNQIEVHDKGSALFGYLGDQRSQTANIIVRRKNVGMASNDLGFTLDKKTGQYQAIISDYDSGFYNKPWMSEVTKRYNLAVIKEEARNRGYSVVEEKTDANGEIYVTVRTY